MAKPDHNKKRGKPKGSAMPSRKSFDSAEVRWSQLAQGMAAIEAIRKGVPIAEVIAKIRTQSGFVNPPAAPASAPNPAASAPQPGGFKYPAPSHFNAGIAAVLNPSSSMDRDNHGRHMDAAAKMLNGEPDRPAWKTEGYAPTSDWSEGARAAGRAFDRQRDEKIFRADIEESHKSAKVMDKAWSRNRHAEAQAQRQADREEATLQADVARRGGGRDDGIIDVTNPGYFNAGANAKEQIRELSDRALGRQSAFSLNRFDSMIIRRGITTAIAAANDMQPINSAANQLEPFLKAADFIGLAASAIPVVGPFIRLGLMAASMGARGIASFRDSRWEAVQSRIDIQRMLYSANDPMAELFANKTALERGQRGLSSIDKNLHNIGFENILDADIRKQVSDRNTAYNSTKGDLAAYGIDFAPILAKYASDRGIDPGMVTDRERNMLLSQTLENVVVPIVGSGRKALYDTSEVEEMIPWVTTWGADRKAVREKMKQDYFNLALEGRTRYGDAQTDKNRSQQHQRTWWANHSPEFRRKFDVDSRESQQQAKAIRKRHTQGF